MAADSSPISPTSTVTAPSRQIPTVELDNPIGQRCVPGGRCDASSYDITLILGRVIRAALGILGGLTLLMFVWGGFQWLTSAGSPEKVKKGSQTMVWAAIGVFIVLASYLILSTFMNYLTGAA